MPRQSNTGTDSTLPRPDQNARRQRVIATATALADSGGYDAVTMKAVAEGSDVALATLYRWFASKDHLLGQALLGWVVELEGDLRNLKLSGPTAADRMATIMARVGDAIAERPRLVSASITALLSDDPTVLGIAGEFHAAIERWIDLATGSDQLRHRDDATELLEHIIFASLIALVHGRDTPTGVGARLERAARLLLV
jgi:AcrR family transcriptional regulator